MQKMYPNPLHGENYHWMEWWSQERPEMSIEAVTMRWTKEIRRAHPDAHIRWARIVGRRWEYLGGNNPDITFSTVRMVINNRIGLCLNNSESMDRRELDVLKDSIGQSLANIDR